MGVRATKRSRLSEGDPRPVCSPRPAEFRPRVPLTASTPPHTQGPAGQRARDSARALGRGAGLAREALRVPCGAPRPGRCPPPRPYPAAAGGAWPGRPACPSAAASRSFCWPRAAPSPRCAGPRSYCCRGSPWRRRGAAGLRGGGDGAGGLRRAGKAGNKGRVAARTKASAQLSAPRSGAEAEQSRSRGSCCCRRRRRSYCLGPGPTPRTKSATAGGGSGGRRRRRRRGGWKEEEEEEEEGRGWEGGRGRREAVPGGRAGGPCTQVLPGPGRTEGSSPRPTRGLGPGPGRAGGEGAAPQW